MRRVSAMDGAGKDGGGECDDGACEVREVDECRGVVGPGAGREEGDDGGVKLAGRGAREKQLDAQGGKGGGGGLTHDAPIPTLIHTFQASAPAPSAAYATLHPIHANQNAAWTVPSAMNATCLHPRDRAESFKAARTASGEKMVVRAGGGRDDDRDPAAVSPPPSASSGLGASSSSDSSAAGARSSDSGSSATAASDAGS